MPEIITIYVRHESMARYIRQTVAYHDMTLASLAWMAGTSAPALSAMLSNKRPFSKGVLGVMGVTLGSGVRYKFNVERSP